jgi:hypothetical protein
MNEQQLKEEIKKLYNQNQIIAGRISDNVFIAEDGKIYNRDLIINFPNSIDTGVLIKNEDTYLFLGEKSNNIILNQVLEQLRRKYTNKKKYLVKTLSLNNGNYFLGGYKKDSKIIDKLGSNFNLGSMHVVNGGSNRYRTSIYRPVVKYVYKTNANKTDININETYVYMGNNMWESNSINFDGVRTTIVDDEIFFNNMSLVRSGAYDDGYCRRSSDDEFFQIKKATWTPNDPNSIFTFTRKLTNIAFDRDPTLSEINPRGIIITLENYDIHTYDQGYASTPYYDEFLSDNDRNAGSLPDNQRVGTITSASYFDSNVQIDYGSFRNVISGSRKTILTSREEDETTIKLKISTKFNLTESIYKYVVQEVLKVNGTIGGGTGIGSFTLFLGNWENVTTRKLQYSEHIGYDDYDEEITIQKSDLRQLTNKITYARGQVVNSNSSSSVINRQYVITPFTEGYVQIGYSFFAPKTWNYYGTDLTVNPENTKFTINGQSYQSGVNFPILFPGFGEKKRTPIPTTTKTITSQQSYEWVSFEKDDYCQTKGRVNSQTYTQEYNGTFVALRTFSGYIIQSISGKIVTRNYKEGNEYKQTITKSNYTNTFTLQLANSKTIKLNTGKCFISSLSLEQQLKDTSTSFSFSFDFSFINNDGLSATSLIGQPFLFNGTIENKFALIKGTISSVTGSTGTLKRITCNIIDIKKNVTTSFKGKLILNNGSIFNYLFRVDVVAVAILNNEHLDRYFLNPMISNVLSGNVDITKLKEDNIINTSSYRVVEIIGRYAYIEHWEITDSGLILFKKVFKTPYYPLDKNSIPKSSSYHPV